MAKYQIGIFTAITFMYFSCTKDKPNTLVHKLKPSELMMSPLENGTKTASFSNEDVFRGVMFLDGPVSNLLDGFSDFKLSSFTNDSSILANAKDFQNEIIASINQTDPGYLDSFRTKIGSGDIYTVEACLNEASEMVYTASLKLTNAKDQSVRGLASAFVSQFTKDYNINNNSSKEELIESINKEFEKDATEPPPNTYKDVYVAEWVAGVIAVTVVVAVEVILAIPADENNSQFNSYLKEKYQSVVTLNLTGI